MNEWIDKIHTMEIAFKRKEILAYATTWMYLEDMLNEKMSQM